MMFSLILIITLVFLMGISAYGQDVEQKYQSLRDRIQNDPLKISGSFSAAGQHYAAFGIPNRALPFSGRLMAALNFDLLGIQMPLSLAISNGGVVFNRRLPSYSFVGISPSYKWAKVLIGTRSLDFGKYSFSNHTFLGGGFELTPGKFYASAFYGRLRRARIEDFAGINNVEPFFRRMGFGAKAGFEDGKDKVMISLFKAWDVEESLPGFERDSSLNFFPSENVIVSTEISKSIGKWADLEIEYSNSGFTADREISATRRNFNLSTYGGLLGRNVSTRNNNAFEANLNFKVASTSFNIGYERIDPEYRTMGALFFNNDLENFSAGTRLKFLKSRIMVNARAGLQRNNLNGDQSNRYNRFVGNLMVNVRATDKLNFTGSYSNYNNVNRRLSFAAIDTLLVVTDLVLSNQNANAGVNWTINNSNSRISGIQGTLTYSQGNTIENDVIKDNQTTNTLNGNLNYYLQLQPTAWSFNVNYAYQQNTIGRTETAFNTLGFQIGKKFLDDKLSIDLGTNYSLSSQSLEDSQTASGRILSGQLSAGYQLTKSSVISFNAGYIDNVVNPSLGDDRRFQEFRNTLNYLYRFNPQK